MNQIRNPLPLEYQIEGLKQLLISLQHAVTILEKLEILNSLPIVQDYLHSSNLIKIFLAEIHPEGDYAIKSVIAIGQGPVVFNMQKKGKDYLERLYRLVQQLLDIEHFYQELGGIIGYHLLVLTMIVQKDKINHLDHVDIKYIHPEGLYLDQDTPEVKQAIRWGLENLDQLAEIYPVGGAGDRLNLVDEMTGVALPAAMLPFIGKSLLEGIIRDLQAREYLYFKIYGKQILTPIAMMTSVEKNNHAHILTICKKKNWFGRPPDSFFFFIQPLVPVITIEGNWSLSSYLTLTLKPGGHGVIWKLARDTGVFSWLFSRGRYQSLIRQINNPLAGVDNTLLALAGVGYKDRKNFGFASCERLLGTAEGTNVLIERKTSKGFAYCLTNIEYTDFAQKGIGEVPAKPGSPFSIYPTNTNILFADIQTIQRTLQKCSLPGQLINMKNKVPYIDSTNQLSYLPGGRLEATMQNIADYLIDEFPYPLEKEDMRRLLQTFIIYNQRVKTISTTKKSFKSGESPVSTPEQAYYDVLFNNLDLLKYHCHFNVPELESIEKYLAQGPNCIFLYHPALGPVYTIIAQKLRQGRLAPGAELKLEIAEIDIENLNLEGSALIESTCPLGYYNEAGSLQYGKESRCILHHVQIRNQGINKKASNYFWKNQIFHYESFYVLLHESSEFQAEGVVFEGDFFFEVPAYHRLKIWLGKNGQLKQELEKVQEPSWQWRYSFDAEDNIKLIKECRGSTQ